MPSVRKKTTATKEKTTANLAKKTPKKTSTRTPKKTKSRTLMEWMMKNRLKDYKILEALLRLYAKIIQESSS